MGFERVVTHFDFDGVVCAALCSHIYGMENIFFTGPRDIANRRFPINERDIVTDLPYPSECGMWFDHHPGNLDDLAYRGIEVEDIPGRFRPDPSCARTVYDFFSEEWDLADYLADTVSETDIIDSFDYADIEDWRRPTPGKNVDAAIKAPHGDLRARNRFLKQLVLWIRDYPLEQIQNFREIVRLRALFEEKEQESLEIIRASNRFLEEDTNHELVIIDLTEYRVRPNIARHMAYLEFPDAKSAILVSNPVVDRRKTTNLGFSMSLAVNMNYEGHGKDVGEIMRKLNMGDGHAGAGAGVLNCATKEEMLRTREETLKEIFEIWQGQEESPK